MKDPHKKRGIVLLAHGSKDPVWKEPFVALQGRLASSLPETFINKAFLKDCQPDINEAVGQMAAAGATHITVIPLFLAIGAHSRNDFPTISTTLEAQWPDLVFEWTEVIGEWREMQEALGNVIKGRIEKESL